MPKSWKMKKHVALLLLVLLWGICNVFAQEIVQDGVVSGTDSSVSVLSDVDSISSVEIDSLCAVYNDAKSTQALKQLLITLRDELRLEIQEAYADSVRKEAEKRHNDSVNNVNMRVFLAMERTMDSMLQVSTAVCEMPFVEIDAEEVELKDTVIISELFLPIVLKNDYKRKENTHVYDTLTYYFTKPLTYYKLPIPPNTYSYTFADSLKQAAISYVIEKHPELVSYTEDMLPKDQIKPEIMATTNSFESLFKVVPELKKSKAAEKIQIELPKIGFWTTKGKLSTSFSQNYMTKNWYQGGENNVNIYNNLVMTANYNNRRNITWNNGLDYRLGINSIPHDPDKKFRINTDYLRINSQLSLRAIKKWDYSMNLDFTTQAFTNRQSDGEAISAFLSPGTVNLSIGMNYNFRNKKNNAGFSFYISPLTYNNRFVIDTALVNPTRHGIKPNHRSIQNYGGLLMQGNINWTISRDISYSSRYKFYTPYDCTQFEWENTINVYVNRYLTMSFFYYLRFDDGREKREGEKSYFQFKEMFSFGLNFWW